jgi:hypothetical protein
VSARLKEKCRFAVASEKPDVLNPEFVPESQYQKERNSEVDTRPQGVRPYAFSEEDMQWYAQECPVVQLWAAGEVEQRSCRKVVSAFMVRGVGDLHGVIEKLIRMDKAADVVHQLTSTYRFDEPTASWAQHVFKLPMSSIPSWFKSRLRKHLETPPEFEDGFFQYSGQSFVDAPTRAFFLRRVLGGRAGRLELTPQVPDPSPLLHAPSEVRTN